MEIRRLGLLPEITDPLEFSALISSGKLLTICYIYMYLVFDLWKQEHAIWAIELWDIAFTNIDPLFIQISPGLNLITELLVQDTYRKTE